MEQRWLTLDGICTLLSITQGHAMRLANQGVLGFMPGRNRKEHRFLSPTPEYVAKLKMGEALYGRLAPIPIELPLTAMLSLREIAEIMGWTIGMARNYAHAGKIPGAVKFGLTNLYSMQVIRDLLFRRQGRKHSKQLDPFLLSELIEFFQSYYARECEEVPTDLQFSEDDLLQRKLARITKMPSPDRENAIRDLWKKVKTAKIVAAALKPNASA